MATTIKLKNGSGAPLAGDLVQGEPALDLTNKRLYTENSGGTIIEVGTNPTEMTIAGDLTVDTNTLVVDSTNNRVGINRTPATFNVEFDGSAQLIYDRSGANTAQVVVGAGGTSNVIIDGDTIQLRDEGGAPQITKDVNGNVGIGQVSPVYTLDLKSTGSSTIANLEAPSDTTPCILTFSDSNNAVGRITYNHATANADTMQFMVASSNKMTIDASGNVGIGRSPNYELDVYRSGTGAPTIASSNDNIVTVLESNGSSYGKLGTITSHDMTFWAGNLERMRIDSSGNVGIGETNPDKGKITVVSAGSAATNTPTGTTDSHLYLQDSDSSPSGTATNIDFGYDNRTSSTARIGAIQNTAVGTDLFFSTSNNYGAMCVERMRLDRNGNLLVGKTVVTASTAGVSILGSDSTIGVSSLNVSTLNSSNSTSNHLVNFRIGGSASASGTASGAIAANGASQAAFVAYSDERLKENIQDLPSQLEQIKNLRPVEFDYKDGSGHQIGFIAQEMRETYSDCVGEDEEGFLTIGGWNKTEARLVKAIQEQQAMIETLQAQVAELQGAN